MKLIIRGGRIVDPSRDFDEKGDLLIEEGKVAEIGKIPKAGTNKRLADAEEIDAKGWIVAPGFIDMHVHLREPGREDKETIASGTAAAAAGGFTSLMCMPNTDPINDNESVTRYVIEQAHRAGLSNVFPSGAVTKGQKGEELAEIGEMVRAGIVAVSDDGHPIMNSLVMRRALEYANHFDVPVVDHCEDLDLAADGCMNEGAASTRLGLAGISECAEELHVARDIMLSRITGGRVHIAHLSTTGALNHVRRGKEDGVSVTCEVTPHHFILSDSDIWDYNTNYKMNPPLRRKKDVEALLEGLADGVVDCIATDHAPHTLPEKDTTFPEAANGIIGLETAIPLAWEYLVRKQRISVNRLVELFSVNPSRILDLERGTLAKGAVADVTLIDPDRRMTVNVDNFKSKSRNSPFQGWSLHGVPVVTIVAGKVVHDART